MTLIEIIDDYNSWWANSVPEPQNEMRILFNTVGEYPSEEKISSTLIARWNPKHEEMARLTGDEYGKEWPKYLYKYFDSDIHLVNPINIFNEFFKLWLNYGFADRETELRFIAELLKVKEFCDVVKYTKTKTQNEIKDEILRNLPKKDLDAN